jgi:hypothetical protein
MPPTPKRQRPREDAMNKREFADKFAELYGLMRLQIGPMAKAEILTIKLSQEFEPHGRSSETWELVWRLELHQIRGHIPVYDSMKTLFPKITGYRPINEGTTMKIKARTLNECLNKAIHFMHWYVEQETA